MSLDTSTMEGLIVRITDEIRDMLVAKNESYGNSAADPVRIFSKASPEEQINVRIDDKLSRIARGSEFGNEDTELDLIGYLILKRAVRQWSAGSMVNVLDEGFEAAARDTSDPCPVCSKPFKTCGHF